MPSLSLKRRQASVLLDAILQINTLLSVPSRIYLVEDDNHAVSFWEAEFDTGQLLPGQSFRHDFTQREEFFYNDPPFPQNTGKIVVY